MAGREALIDREMRALRAGPGHPEFCVAFVGRRGVGKTTLLDTIGAKVGDELGWATLHVQAMREESLLPTITQRMPDSVRPWGRLGRDFKRFQADLKVSVNLGVVSASATVHSPAASEPSAIPAAFEILLRNVGEFAKRNDTGLLISVDEAQACAPQDLAAMARAAQMIVSRGQLPVALAFSGLPTFRERMATAGTFASRLPTHDIGDLERSATRLALVEPAASRHVAWEPAALDLVAESTAGHPYYVQLFGYHTWEAAAGADTLTADHARAGLAAARQTLDGQFLTTWSRLRPKEREYLAAVNHSGTAPGEPVPVDVVARQLGYQPRQLAVPRDRLIHVHGLLEAPQRGLVQFTSSELALWVAHHHD